MAMQVIGDLTVRVGEYKDANGEKRGRYQKIGVEYRKEDGSQLYAIDPAFLSPSLLQQMSSSGVDISRSLFLSVFPRRDGNGGGEQRRSAPAQQAAKPQQQASAPGNGEDFNDDIPF
jgi:hypothetical protein